MQTGMVVVQYNAQGWLDTHGGVMFVRALGICMCDEADSRGSGVASYGGGGAESPSILLNWSWVR